VWNVLDGTAFLALSSVTGAGFSACPFYDGDDDVLLFESSAGLDADDANGSADLYLAFEPFSGSPTIVRVGEDLVADVGGTNFFHSCMGATLSTVAGGLEVVVTTTAQLAGDQDGTADVFAVAVNVDDKTVGALRSASFSQAAACGSFTGQPGIDRLAGVGENGTFLLVSSNQGTQGLPGRMACP